MNIVRRIATSTLLATSLIAAGCGDSGSGQKAATAGAPAASTGGGFLANIASEAQSKIATENLSLSDNSLSLPKAELTPAGDLLIAGSKVAVNAEQHALLVKHRQILEQVARDGVAVGMEGVDLAGKAISHAIGGALSGDKDATKARIESDASQVKDSARRLCADLPELLASQQRLAAALPEFRPYARMTEDNAKDCHSN